MGMPRTLCHLMDEPIFRFMEDLGAIVDVHWNFHKKVFSVTAVAPDEIFGKNQVGKVIAQVEYLAVADAAFRVSEAGRQRVLRQKKKNVHAKVRGELVSFRSEDIHNMRYAIYNPYVHKGFVLSGNKERPLQEAELCIFLVEEGKPVMRVRRPSFTS